MAERISQKDFARQLRKNQTETEALMWRYLRNRKFAAFKFRRQHPIGNYIADFACLSKKIVIEIDGETHFEKEAYDHARDEFMKSQGYRILRYDAIFLAKNEDIVLHLIWEALNEPG